MKTTDSNTNLILNLARNAPWLIDDGTNVFPEVLPGDCHKILEEIRDSRLTIITEQGQVYEQHQSLALIDGKLRINKPLEWRDESAESFYVFFRNQHSNWNYFHAEEVLSYPSFLQINPPGKIYFLQQRRYHRVETPIDTRVIFKGSDNRMDSAHVKDISEGGMLIYDNSVKNKYPVDSIIKEIFITIPPNQTTAGRIIAPLISTGEVLRTFYDHKQGATCYGVRFFYKSAYVKEKIHSFVTFLENLSVQAAPHPQQLASSN